jgi:hypothetical protein
MSEFTPWQARMGQRRLLAEAVMATVIMAAIFHRVATATALSTGTLSRTCRPSLVAWKLGVSTVEAQTTFSLRSRDSTLRLAGHSAVMLPTAAGHNSVYK